MGVTLMMYSQNTPPLIPLRARVERLIVGPAGQVRREGEKQSDDGTLSVLTPARRSPWPDPEG